MGMKGKNINLFLMDGQFSGRIKCTLSSWTGVVYKIPRKELDKCEQREDLKQSGVYLLFGVNEETEDKVVYIGQAGSRGILARLIEHKNNSDKDYWNEAVILITSNNSFGQTEISYLENKFCDIAKEVNRYNVKNEKTPSMGNITEEKEAEMEEVIDYFKVVIGALGYKVFVPLVEKKLHENNLNLKENSNDNIELFLERKIKNSGASIKAYGLYTNEGVIVLKGSMVSPKELQHIPYTISERRKSAKIDKNNILQEDLIFNSPSYASGFVVGGSSNGRTDWKTKDGTTLKDLGL